MNAISNWRKNHSLLNTSTNLLFHYRVNLRRNFCLKPNNSRYLFGSLIDIDKDFDTLKDYNGPEFTISTLCDQVTLYNIEMWFRKGHVLPRKYTYMILKEIEIYYKQNCPVLVDIKLPKDGILNICGDIHGQFYDLMKIFQMKGLPGEKNFYLFNGDIVDKGPKSVECILILFLLKLIYPKFVFINRGNHECAQLNIRNGFSAEVKTKYDDLFLFEFFGEIFTWMPLVHLIENRIFVVHGGLSSNQANRISDIRAITRPAEPQRNPLVADLLWSDPASKPGFSESKRGIGTFFGPDITKFFLEQNDLLFIIRSHSEIKEGCGMNHDGCYTVYSAPNIEKKVDGGIMDIYGKYLTKEGFVFKACTQQEIESFQKCETSLLSYFNLPTK